jgi:hypothetical protein
MNDISDAPHDDDTLGDAVPVTPPHTEGRVLGLSDFEWPADVSFPTTVREMREMLDRLVYTDDEVCPDVLASLGFTESEQVRYRGQSAQRRGRAFPNDTRPEDVPDNR